MAVTPLVGQAKLQDEDNPAHQSSLSLGPFIEDKVIKEQPCHNV
jgi:hypothetical protein